MTYEEFQEKLKAVRERLDRFDVKETVAGNIYRKAFEEQANAAPIEEPAEESEAARRYREKLEFRRAIGRIS